MKLPLFQQIVELNHSFDEPIAGQAELGPIPFFQRDTPIVSFSTISRRLSSTTANGPIGSSATSTRGSRIETTSTSRFEIRNRGESGRDCLHESSSFPIGIGLTKDRYDESSCSGERSPRSKGFGQLEPTAKEPRSGIRRSPSTSRKGELRP